MDTIDRAARLTSAQIRAITTIAESWGWTDVTRHYGDPDCDLIQTFEKGDVYAQITWKGTGRHEQILTVEAYNRRPLFYHLRPDGLLFYSQMGTQRDLMSAACTLLTTA